MNIALIIVGICLIGIGICKAIIFFRQNKRREQQRIDKIQKGYLNNKEVQDVCEKIANCCKNINDINWETQYKELIPIFFKDGIELISLNKLKKHCEFENISLQESIPMFLYKKNMAFDIKISVKAFQYKDYIYNHITQRIKNYELRNIEKAPQVKQD